MKERIVKHKLFLVYDFDKEEEWLNEMAMQGWVLVEIGFCKYVFERSEPGEYIIKLAFVDGSTEDYISLVRESGGEYIGNFLKWAFFRRKSEYGNFELNSDKDSRIRMLRSVGKMLSVVGYVNLGIGTVNVINGMTVGVVNCACACLLFYCCGRIHGKIDELKRIRKYYE